jgi:transposase InsO family protein
MPDPTVATAALTIVTAMVALLDALRAPGARSGLAVALVAEIAFLRRQLALYEERGVKPKRPTRRSRLVMALASRHFDWRGALVVVKPATLIRWQRLGFRLLWRLKSRPGRPPLPLEARQLIRRLAVENPSWGEERIAAELLLKLGLRVSPRTIAKYMPRWIGTPRGDQRWATFVRNHARAIVATDLCTVVTARFQVLYVLVVMEVGSRRILHANVTAHPTSAWVAQQLRHAIPDDHAYRFLLHDRDAVFSADADRTAKAMGLRVLRSPVRAPRANSFCERLIGTLRRECLDWLIPWNERHLRLILRE